jgi:nitrogen regulatory protein PII
MLSRMKEIKAFVREHMLTRVVDALARDGFLDFSVSEARGIARGLPEPSYTYSVGMGEPFLRMARLEIVCRDESVRHLVETIQQAGSTGRPGDGYVFVTDVGLAVRIRDGAEGEETLPK